MNNNLTQSLIEDIFDLVILKNQLLQTSQQHQDIATIFHTQLQRLNIITSKLQEEIFQTMVRPISNFWEEPIKFLCESIPRLEQKVNFLTTSNNVMLDQHLMELLKEPIANLIIHLVNY